MQTAKIFWSGRSQAVRLPKEFRFCGEEVLIRRRGATVILEPVPDDWAWLDAIAGRLDDDFAQAATEESPQQQRPALDKHFRLNALSARHECRDRVAQRSAVEAVAASEAGKAK